MVTHSAFSLLDLIIIAFTNIYSRHKHIVQKKENLPHVVKTYTFLITNKK